MDFIKRKGIDTVLKSDTKTLIGFSAGAINISEHAIVIQDDSVDESTVYDGLNLTGGISVDVHYTEVKDADIREVQAKWAIETIYAIPENSGILIHGDDIKFIGTEPVVRF
ncbi:MAG: Type 1 glutamine amidotransferase-like domain-containing protein, partial [Clostridia bacterium]|nr:Type 1 glutamine amidotransferase-like domain-containing protein [Clostridia bacterium]